MTMFQDTFSSSPAYLPARRKRPVCAVPEVNIALYEGRVGFNVIIPAMRPGENNARVRGGLPGYVGARDEAVFAVICEMVNWIDHHLDTCLTVQRISQRSGYSVWHLQRKFVQFTGLNVYEYVRIRRVISAAFALTRTRKTILDIAVENGFSCQTAFTRTLRNMARLTPGRMRRNFTGNEAWLIALIESLLHPARNISAV